MYSDTPVWGQKRIKPLQAFIITILSRLCHIVCCLVYEQSIFIGAIYVAINAFI